LLLLKQATDLKTLPIGHVTQFTTVAPSCLRLSLRAEARVRSQVYPLAIIATKLLSHYMVTSWYIPPPVSTLTLTLRTHTITPVHTTKSHNSLPSVTKVSFYVCLKHINYKPVSSLVFVDRIFRIGFWVWNSPYRYVAREV